MNEIVNSIQSGQHKGAKNQPFMSSLLETQQHMIDLMKEKSQLTSELVKLQTQLKGKEDQLNQLCKQQVSNKDKKQSEIERNALFQNIGIQYEEWVKQ
jgi:hypothetical protein